MIIIQIKKTITDLVALLEQLSDAQFTTPFATLSNATIGEHSRHVIEMFGCLEQGYESGKVNYDLRKRNLLMQTDTDFAIQNLIKLQENLEKINKKMWLEIGKTDPKTTIETNYERELWYNFEHCIHHQALIKVGALSLENISIDPNFGVAQSTIAYRTSCAP